MMMTDAQRQEHAAKFIVTNAQNCLSAIEIAKFLPSRDAAVLLQGIMIDVAKLYEETFGLPAPWMPEETPE